MPLVSSAKKFFPLLALMAGLSASAQTAPNKPAVLTIEADHTLHTVSPMLYGTMTEEINYSYDGGLYAELVKNRALRDTAWSMQDWLVVQNASGGAKFEKD